MSPVIIACIAYICAMNLFIGLYIGRRGARRFIGIGPGAVLLWLFCIGGVFFIRYAQDSYGFHATPKDIVFSLAFGVIGWIVGRVLRGEK
jgi:hypothetical protein